MAAKKTSPHDIARRYCMGTILKWLLIRDKTQEEIFNLSQPTWLSRRDLKSDFTLEEIRTACFLLDIPSDEQLLMLTGGYK